MRYSILFLWITTIVTDAKTSTLIHSVVNVSMFYKKIRFHISTLHVDGKFDTSHIWGAVAELNVTLNPVSKYEHVPEAERDISTIKKRSRCMQFGEYVKTHGYHNKITGTARTIGSLDFLTTWNEKGGYYFYSLRTDRKIHCNICTPLTMPDYYISRIHAISQNYPMGITFTNRNEKTIEEDDDEDD